MPSVKYVTGFEWFCGMSDFLNQRMRSPVQIHCCKQPNYNFCISQGSVETALGWGGQNYSRLR